MVDERFTAATDVDRRPPSGRADLTCAGRKE